MLYIYTSHINRYIYIQYELCPVDHQVRGEGLALDRRPLHVRVGGQDAQRARVAAQHHGVRHLGEEGGLGVSLEIMYQTLTGIWYTIYQGYFNVSSKYHICHVTIYIYALTSGRYVSWYVLKRTYIYIYIYIRHVCICL